MLLWKVEKLWRAREGADMMTIECRALSWRGRKRGKIARRLRGKKKYNLLLIGFCDREL